MRVSAAFIIAAGLTVVANAASADTIARVVKANSRTAVGGLFTYGVGTCRAGEFPEVTIREQPSYGTVVVQTVTVLLDASTNCAGSRVTGPALVYTPRKGFRGTDRFTIDFPFASNESRPATMMSRTYELTVQ